MGKIVDADQTSLNTSKFIHRILFVANIKVIFGELYSIHTASHLRWQTAHNIRFYIIQIKKVNIAIINKDPWILFSQTKYTYGHKLFTDNSSHDGSTTRNILT